MADAKRIEDKKGTTYLVFNSIPPNHFEGLHGPATTLFQRKITANGHAIGPEYLPGFLEVLVAFGKVAHAQNCLSSSMHVVFVKGLWVWQPGIVHFNEVVVVGKVTGPFHRLGSHSTHGWEGREVGVGVVQRRKDRQVLILVHASVHRLEELGMANSALGRVMLVGG